MKIGLLPLLQSPCCKAELKFAEVEQFPRTDGFDIQEGQIRCSTCRRDYPLLQGVPRLMLEDGEKSSAVDASSAGSTPDDQSLFLGWSQLVAEDVKGKLVLDAGCGLGRFAVVALSLGGEVVALDRAENLRRLAAVAPDWPRLHVVEGDLLDPPLRPASFDVAYSAGALHRSTDPRAAFSAAARLVKPRGLLSVWGAGARGPFAWLMRLLRRVLRSKSDPGTAKLSSWFEAEGFRPVKTLPPGSRQPGVLGRRVP